MTVTALIDKLIDIERSLGVESNSSVRERIIDVEDYALGMQREIGEILRECNRHNQVQVIPDPSLTLPARHSGWRIALASLQRTIF
ncbi:MAG: hypothetical protein ABR928_18100 [Terracidiphilus sp.]|jgi:hypothetical protein